VQRVRHQRNGVKRMRADAAMRLTQRTRTGLPPTHGHPVRPSALHLPQHIRRREQKMERSRSAGPAQRFLSSHSAVYNTFNIGRHLTTASMRRITPSTRGRRP
jgi:transposase-like protein